jgi:peptide/nickel transport system substrate-binding protein
LLLRRRTREDCESSSARFAVTLLAGAALALAVLGPASAQAGSRYGGVLVVGLSGGDPDSLDPTVGRNTSALVIYPAMCQRLYDRDAKLQLLPVLAAAVPALSKDKLSYTIQLRKGIEFNDGTPFNAQAVVTTIRRIMTYPGASRVSDYAGVDSVTASGPYTLVYHLKRRDSTFVGGNPYVLSPTALAGEGDNFAAHPVCVGPFMFDHRVVGDNVTLIKSPYYYDKYGVYLDKIVYKPMPVAAAAAAALEAGDIQVLDNLSTTELSAVQQTSSLRVIQAPQLGWQGLYINIGNKNGVLNLPYTNAGTPLASSAKLRQAFEEAIDRNTMNKVVFGGLEQVSCTPIPPADTPWFDSTKVSCTPYNPADARKLIAASGFSNPTVHLLTNNTTDRLRLAQFIQAQEAAVGINVVIDPFDSATASARALSGSFDVYLASAAPGNVDPSTNITSRLATSGPNNSSGYSNPRLDLILDNGLKATTTRARSTLYHVAQEIIQVDRPIIVLYNAVTFAAFSTKLTEVQLTPNGKLSVENAQYT